MDDDGFPQPDPESAAAARRARTLVIRWWPVGEPAGGRRTRGTVRDIGGLAIGSFDNFEDMVELLRLQADKDCEPC